METDTGQVSSSDGGTVARFWECQVDVEKSEQRILTFINPGVIFGHKHLLPIVLSFLLNVYGTIQVKGFDTSANECKAMHGQMDQI